MTRGQSTRAHDGPAERLIRVMIVDDVKSARDLLADILATDPGFEVVACVGDGLEAVQKAFEVRPDLITMDIRLPGLDGFLAVERILAEFTVPIVMITASHGEYEEKVTRALKLGALDVIEKQELYLWRTRPEIRTTLLRKLHILARARVGQRHHRGVGSPLPSVGPSLLAGDKGEAPLRVVAIAASTGGPSALVTLFKQIPADVNAAFLVVQHMSCGFLDGLIHWLDHEVALTVRKAQDGDMLKRGVVLFAPEDYHLLVNEDGKARLNKSLPIAGHRPSAELLFKSVATSFGRRGIGVILTGMGSDGAVGLKRLRERGGHTIAQNEVSSIIFGMPRAAIEQEAAEVVLSLEAIAPQLMNWMREGTQ
ncbi:MAG: chemotaxis-specific protein-glutamate methyltransferase CheB [Nitrospirota bacterium]